MNSTSDVKIGDLVEFEYHDTYMVGFLYWAEDTKYRFKIVNRDPYAKQSAMYFNNSRYVKSVTCAGWKTYDGYRTKRRTGK